MLNPFDPTPPQAPADPGPAAAAAADDATPVDAPSSESAEADATTDNDAAEVAEVDDDEVFEADEVLIGATDQARAALELITPADTIGEQLGYIVEGEHVLSLLFECLMSGYPGWHWTVSVSRVDTDSEPQVLETELMPGDDALLAPEWVPWSDRLADSKVAEELAAAGLVGSDDDDDSDDDEDDSDDDDDEDDESAESDDAADDGVDVLDGIDVDEALAASKQDETEAAEAEAQADGGAPQPPAQAGVVQFSSEDERQHQQD